MSHNDPDDDSSQDFAASENMSVAGFSKGQLEGCYWCGRIKFEADLACAVHRASKSRDEIPDLDTYLDELIAGFPYKHELDAIKMKLSFSVTSTFETYFGKSRQAYLTLVGVLNGKGLPADKDLYAERIEQYARSAVDDQNYRDAVKEEFGSNNDQRAVETPSTPRMKSETPPTSPGSPASSEEENDEFRLRWGRNSLYHFGLKTGFRPVYRTETRTNPTGILAIVTCGDKSFEAFGTSKKMAEKMAAVKACDAMNVAIVPLAG